MLDEQGLDEYPCSANLARRNTASLRETHQRLGVNLEKERSATEVKRRGRVQGMSQRADIAILALVQS